MLFRSNDELGEKYEEGLKTENVKYYYSKKKEELTTGTCLILVTPDSERTMCTFLGTAGKINESDVDIMLGHSLGEYTALACSNKISLKDSSLILKKRGELMNLAVTPNKTGMAALIGLPSNEVQDIINHNNLNLEIANDNSKIQIVISGDIEDLNNSRE